MFSVLGILWVALQTYHPFLFLCALLWALLGRMTSQGTRAHWLPFMFDQWEALSGD